MANMFDKFQKKSNGKRATFSTRSATPCTCTAMQTAVFHNNFKEGAEEQRFRLLFAADSDDGLITQWSPWITMSQGMFDKKSNAMKLFDNQVNVLENVGDVEWLFSQQWSVLGIANGNFVNIKTIFHEDNDLKDAQFYDLAGYPPFDTCKCFREVAPVLEMYVRLEDGTAHKVEEAEFKKFNLQTEAADEPF